MKRILGQKVGQINLEEIKKVASDHFDHPYSICRHIDDGSKAENRMETIVSVIMDLNERSMYLSEGNPCENEYKEVPLEL